MRWSYIPFQRKTVLILSLFFVLGAIVAVQASEASPPPSEEGGGAANEAAQDESAPPTAAPGEALAPGEAEAGSAAPPYDETRVALDTVWVLFCAFLVMFMALGFALLESGLCRAKNTANIIAKNFVVFALTSIVFLMVGFGFMFGDGSDFIGYKGLWFLTGEDNSPVTGDTYQGVYSSLNWTGIPLPAKFLFQMVFAATAATIVSGAVAERIKFSAFFIFALLIAGLLYPIVGHWIWGGGWLQQKGMLDFAGSTVVHSVGGWAALAGAIMLGPRIGKFRRDGKVNPIPGHNLTSAAIGVFVLWFGWFGFNPGSAMAASFDVISHAATTTNTAAAAGAVAATFTAWALLGKPDLTMSLNGGIAGLVAITCPCAFVSIGSSLFIGLVAGVAVVLAVLFFDRIRVDDPVGAISVHLICGIWGTLALGLFGDAVLTQSLHGDGLLVGSGLLISGGGPELFIVQLTGVAAVGGLVFFGSLVGWAFLKAAMGIRVPPDAEVEGLDFSEHGNVAYADFTMATSRHPAVLSVPEERVTRAPPPKAPTASSSSGREPPAVRRQPETRRTPPSSRPASPPTVRTTNGGAFAITVPNVDKKFLEEMWGDLCRKYSVDPQNVPREFGDLYGNVQSFSGTTWKFSRGNAEDCRRKLETILSTYGAEQAHVQVG